MVEKQIETRKDYHQYLLLDELLEAQQPVSTHPDELEFIIVHQVHELWFKLAINYLERAQEALHFAKVREATHLLGRATSVLKNTVETNRHLHALPPASFSAFRDLLAPGSGLQSFQFREIEFICGLRSEHHIRWIERTAPSDAIYKRIKERLQTPSLRELLHTLLKYHQVESIAEVYTMMDLHRDLYHLCESLSELDHRLLDWRYTHVQLVERTLGTAPVGTGGTTHDYLRKTLESRCFPELWESRNQIFAPAATVRR